MTDDVARAVQSAVRQFLRDHERFRLGDPENFDLLFEATKRRMQVLGKRVAEDDLGVVTAMCWLGLEYYEIPPVSMRQELLDIVRQYVPRAEERLARVMEFAVAYGCGWRRNATQGRNWNASWSNAVAAFQGTVEPAVSGGDRWLRGIVRCAEDPTGMYPVRDRDRDGNEDKLKSDADTLRLHLVWPLKPLHVSMNGAVRFTCLDEEMQVAYPGGGESFQRGAKASYTVSSEASLELTRKDRLRRGATLPAETRLVVSMHDDDALTEATSMAGLIGQAYLDFAGRTALTMTLSERGEGKKVISRVIRFELDPNDRVALAQTSDGVRIDIGKEQFKSPLDGRIVLAVTRGKARFVLAGGCSLPLGGGWKITITSSKGESEITARWAAKMNIGDKARLTGGNDLDVSLWACSCGTKQCAERHRLGTWRPEVASLWAFVGSAVNGPYDPIRTGAFAQGMYYGLLSKEGVI